MILSKSLASSLASLEGRVQRIAQLLDMNKAEQIVVLDVRGICDFTEAFVLVTARSSTHLQALAHHLQQELREQGLRSAGQLETRSPHWAVLDFSSVVVHIFDEQTRAYYNLEALWGDAQAMEWPDVQMA